MIIINPKVLITAVIAFFTFNSTFSQSIALESVNSVGATMTQSTSSLIFTVGELVVLNFTDDNGNSLRGGFTNSSTISTSALAILKPLSDFLNVDVYPNPTSDLINIKLNSTLFAQIKISITDLNGKEVYNGIYAGISNTIGINTKDFKLGTYIINLKSDKNETIGIYKIIKQ
jgi:hypothetical protein